MLESFNDSYDDDDTDKVVHKVSREFDGGGDDYNDYDDDDDDSDDIYLMTECISVCDEKVPISWIVDEYDI